MRDLSGSASMLTVNPRERVALLAKDGFIDDKNCILVREMFDHTMADDVTQLICIPAVAPKNGQAAPRSGIARRVRAHPACLEPLASKQTVENSNLPTPRLAPTSIAAFHLSKRRRPQIKRADAAAICLPPIDT